MPSTVIVADVPDAAAAERVLDALAGLGPDTLLLGGAVLHRSSDGRLDVGRTIGDVPAHPQRLEHPTLTALVTVVVGAIDSLLLGSTLMSAGGPLTVGPDDAVVERLARSIRPGGTAVVAELTEPDPAAVDRLVAEAGGTVERYRSDELGSGAEPGGTADGPAAGGHV